MYNTWEYFGSFSIRQDIDDEGNNIVFSIANFKYFTSFRSTEINN